MRILASLHVWIIVLVCVAFAAGNEYNVVKQLLDRFNIHAEFNYLTEDTLCTATWRIKCAYDSITELSLYGVDIPGEFPNDLLEQLPNLTTVDASHTSFSGFLSQTLLNRLIQIKLTKTLLQSTVPEVNPNVEHLDLSETPLSGTIPAQWAQLRNLKYFTVNDAAISCPIPAEVLENLKNLSLSGQLTKCLLRSNFFYYENGKLCGDANIHDNPCLFLPTLDIHAHRKPQSFLHQDSTTKNVIQITDTRIFIGTKYPNDSVVEKEHCFVQFHGAVVEFPNGTFRYKTPCSKFDLPSGFSSKRIVLTMVSYSHPNTSEHHFLGFTRTDIARNGEFAVFGQVENLCELWLSYRFTEKGVKISFGTDGTVGAGATKLSFAVQFGGKIPLVDERTNWRFNCSPFNSSDSLTCNTVGGEMFIRANYFSGSVETGASGEFTHQTHEWVLTYEVDSYPAVGIPRYLASAFVPFGNDQTIVATDGQLWPVEKDAQSFAISFLLEMIPPQEYLIYDPDITITTLFDVTDAGSDALIALWVVLALLGAGVVLIIALAIFSPAFRRKVFPFTSRKSVQRIPTGNADSTESSSKWQTAQPDKFTNVHS